MKLLIEALTKFTCGLLLAALLLFLPAGTIQYPYGWYFIALLFVPMLGAAFDDPTGVGLLVCVDRFCMLSGNYPCPVKR